MAAWKITATLLEIVNRLPKTPTMYQVLLCSKCGGDGTRWVQMDKKDGIIKCSCGGVVDGWHISKNKTYRKIPRAKLIERY